MKLSLILSFLLLFSGGSLKAEQKNQDMNQNKTLTIDFYHDVICSWCYVMSPRLRKLAEENPNIKVNHRSFALFPNIESIVYMFGSKEKGKKQIMAHWRAASARLKGEVPELNADLMEKKEFDYPHSMPGLLACKAAEKQGGNDMHWAFFDAIQTAHLVEGKNIGSQATLIEIAKKLKLDIDQFKTDLELPETRNLVDVDIKKAAEMGVNSVPTIVIDGKHKISGAGTYEELKQKIESLLEY